MDIEYLIAVFERKLMLQRYSAGSVKNYSSSVRSFLQVAEKRFDQPDELNENEIEKYVYRKIRKDHISSSYQRFANVLFCARTIFIFHFLSLCIKLSAVSFSHLPVLPTSRGDVGRMFGGMKSLGIAGFKPVKLHKS